MPTAALVLLNLVAALTVGYFIIYIYYIRRAFRSLYARPYNRYRMANQLVRLHVRLRGLTFGFFTATIVVYTYVGFNTCSSFIYSWLGYTPMQASAACSSAVFYPISCPHSSSATEPPCLPPTLRPSTSRRWWPPRWRWRRATSPSPAAPASAECCTFGCRSLRGRSATSRASAPSAAPRCRPSRTRASAWTASPSSRSALPLSSCTGHIGCVGFLCSAKDCAPLCVSQGGAPRWFC
jgi:hypothetical protein